jgi:4-hydroxyphenylpyruvate dioxygenase-like putative hemolysin
MFSPTEEKSSALNANYIRHIDHITYVTELENERSFINHWETLGFTEHVRLRCVRYPATHIALISGTTPEYPWATMTGLSVSEDPKSPVNEFVRRYGAGIQHCAYNIHPDADMEEVHESMKKMGVKFMTPVLTYNDNAGAHLRQMFVPPARPFGTFHEYIQRLPGPDGNAFAGFDTSNIDDLYECYSDVSRALEK